MFLPGRPALSHAVEPAPPPGSLADRMGHENAFNTIRLLAAIAVIFSHAYEMTGYPEPLERFTGQSTIGQLAVAAFFVISGFLISTSFDRSRFASFVEKRARRILPGLIVAVLVTALVVGPLVTALTPSAYFSARGTWLFMGQAAFLPVPYDLPGVFADHPVATANGSLWSLKFEVACYAGVVALLIFERLRKPATVLAWLASFAIAGPYGALVPKGTSGAEFYIVLLASLFRFFGTGMVFYLFARHLRLDSRWAWLALALCVLAAFTPFFVEALALAGSYALIVFAYAAPDWFRKLTAKGDISYGVYVYAYPIQQLVVPAALGLAAATGLPAPLMDSLLALPGVVIAGVLSWLLVEKPMIHFGRRRAGKEVAPSAA